MKKLQLTFNKKFRSTQRIGLGAQTQIYLGFELATEKQHAIKVEPTSQTESVLQREAKIYKIVKNGIGIPHLYWYGVEHNYRVLVTDILGPSLQQLLKYCKGTFTLKTVLLVFDQIFDRIEWIHSKGLIYNDVDPENFLVGLKEMEDKIFITDFGSCQKYLDLTGTHVKLGDEPQHYKSNIRFKSVHSHIRKKTGRKDDLESLGYMMVYLLKGKLPWDEIQAEEHEDIDLLIKQKKVSTPIFLLCSGLPDEFQKYFVYVNSLEYEEEPDYSWIKRLFKDLFDSKGYHNNRVLDWAERHKY